MEEENNTNNEEEHDVEVMEFSLNDDEIEELVLKLNLLKEEKTSFNFGIDDENEFIVHYDNEEEVS